jgi:hypothetical protein
VFFWLSINATDEDGRTALHCAAEWGRANCVKVLLDGGVGYCDTFIKLTKPGVYHSLCCSGRSFLCFLVADLRLFFSSFSSFVHFLLVFFFLVFGFLLFPSSIIHALWVAHAHATLSNRFPLFLSPHLFDL